MKSFDQRKERIKASLGEKKAELVLKNAEYLNVFTNSFMRGDIAVHDGYIVGIGSYEGEEEVDMTGKTVVPGFIDSHLHLESSIVSPRQYARAVLPHGTTAIVADPHEIANVLGTTGIDYILASTRKLPFEIYLMMPSCVPATCFDESGAVLTHETVKEYLKKERVLGLAEMMNYPGVLGCDQEVLKKIQVTMKKNKLLDGHAPGLTGHSLNAYITAGISSDHECTTQEEAMEKLSCGQWIMIREGTAGKNLEKLIHLLDAPYFERCMLVTDDKHPGELAEEGHVDHIVRKAIRLGADPVHALKAASYNAARYFQLRSRGAIAPGYQADLVVLADLNTVEIVAVYKRGVCVSQKGKLLEQAVPELTGNISDEELELYRKKVCNTVKTGKIHRKQLQLKQEKGKVIGLVPGEILTTDQGEASETDPEKDIIKLCVVERHHATGHVGVAFLKGYGLKRGAVATTVAHDSHNIIVAGADDEDILCAIRRLEELQGGMVVVENGKILEELALPIAGLMCDLPVEEVQQKLDLVKAAARSLGVNEGIDPFMTLSFTSLPVIPKLRLTTLGVVDVERFSLIL